MPHLDLLSDFLLLVATIGMAAWCRLLMRRQRAFDDLDDGPGRTVALLSAQVEELTASLRAAGAGTEDRARQLRAESARADDRIGRMEMLLASLADIEAEAIARLADVSDDDSPPLPSFRAARSVDLAEAAR